MEKAYMIQKQARENVQEYQSCVTDLSNWEAEMKRKEAALKGQFEQDLPPVRSKIKKEKPTALPKKPPAKRISSSDYQSWDKFDVDKACEDVEMADVGPTSLDGKKSQPIKQSKLREEAQYEKERGNKFVKLEQWTEALTCYNRAIELVNDDAIYYANRGLCHLKRDNLHLAESDCSEAIRLDPTYVKAYQRRAAAREKLGSLKAASNDLIEVIKLEPQNNAARKQLEMIKIRMGTKGSKSKSSPTTTPIVENKPFRTNTQPKIIELEDPPMTPKIVELNEKDTNQRISIKVNEETKNKNWKMGRGENLMVIQPVKKPPHLRSKQPLKPIPIEEIPLGQTKAATRMKIIELDDGGKGDVKNTTEKAETKPNTQEFGDFNTKAAKENDIVKEFLNFKDSVNDRNAGKISDKQSIENTDKKSKVTEQDAQVTSNNQVKADEKKLSNQNNLNLNADKAKLASPESEKLNADFVAKENNNNLVDLTNLVPPANSVQFMQEWKFLKDKENARSYYLSIIEPTKMATIFHNALESDVLSDIIQVLNENPATFQQKGVAKYLKGLCNVKRFSALAMFLSSKDKESLQNLLTFCVEKEQCKSEEINDLKNKFEL